MANCPGIYSEKRVAKLIQRDTAGNDLIVLDILGTDEGKQGLILADGIKNLTQLQFSRDRESEAFQEGSTLPPFARIEERLPEIPILARARSTEDLINIETLLWSVVHRRRWCYLRVYDPFGGWRELRVTLASAAEEAGGSTSGRIYGSTPFMLWTIKLVAPDPFWRSREIKSTVKRSEMTLSGGAYRGQFTWSNPCDNDGYLEFASGTITATETWTLPDGDAVYTARNAPTPAQIGQRITHTLPALGPGKEFLVSTYPTTPLLMVRDGSQEWARMRAEHFDFPLDYSTPQERTAPVSMIGGTANSTVTAYVVQRWDRPIGGEALNLGNVESTELPT